MGGGDWAACRGCLVGAAPGYEVPELECGTPRLHQLILQRRLHRSTTVIRKERQTGPLFSKDLPQTRGPHTDITTGAPSGLD